jgi:hypothetical protein
MDCYPAGTRSALEGPRHWEQSIRSIDGYCTGLLNAGYAVTLFLSPSCAAAHEPLVEELAERGVELGLFVHPPSLTGGSGRGHLGQFDPDTQRTLIQRAIEGYQDTVGARPLSVRPSMFSASDATFGIFAELGFRQGSVSSPGRRVPKHGADWTGAERDAHYVDISSRLQRGNVPFLEIPVTTDPNQVRGGVSADLGVENGTVEKWHGPLIEAQLARMEEEPVAFKALCFFTRNVFAYNAAGDSVALTLDQIIHRIDSLRERYDVRPVTAAGAHAAFRSNE